MAFSPESAAPLPGAPPGLPGYAELHCLSNYSFLRGASHPEELVAQAAALGYQALALTDEASLAGIVRAHVEAKRHGLRLLVGSSVTLPGTGSAPALSLVLLAASRQGYGNLCELLSLGRQRAVKGSYRLAPDDLAEPPPALRHLAGLPGCLALLAPGHGLTPAQLAAQAAWLARYFPGRGWLGLTQLLHADDRRHLDAVMAAAQRTDLPVVATGRVEMHQRSRKPLHDLVGAIRLGRSVQDCGRLRAPNGEQHLRSRLQLARLYPPEALAQTLLIAERCRFSLDELDYHYPDVPSGPPAQAAGAAPPAGGNSGGAIAAADMAASPAASPDPPPARPPAEALREAALAGAAWRFPAGTPEAVRRQLEHELALITELRYEAYFLTVYDIVNFARGRGILCQGRGSAANSAVCYCLGITEIDPSRSSTLFERFISKERNEPPDIDVDFEHQRREEVIQYIYERYGRHKAALTAVVITYRVRSALRDTGRALGMDPALIDRLTRAHGAWDGRDQMAKRAAACGLDPEAPAVRQWLRLAERLMGFPRHLSQHPGGFVISRDPLHRLVPIEPAAMPGRSIVQWDKDDLDAMGMLKVDVLALGMLSMLRRALAFVAWRRGTPFRLADIPPEDPATYDMICAADTMGTFQIESRAQMSMLPRLRPRCYYELVIEIAIVRPGPIQGGMVHPYLRRKQGLEDVTYPGPEVKEALSRTLGVPIFQEQVMQVAMLAADFTPGEADSLRRSMAAWRRRGGLAHFHDRLIQGMARRGYAREFAEQIFQQIQGFGEYGFPESHSASFALLAYASAWLKRHEPEAFLAALLNSQPMGFYSPSGLVQDARRHGVRVLPVDVTLSQAEASLEAARCPGAPAGPAAASAPGARTASRSAPQASPAGHTAPRAAHRPAVRLGLNQVRGLSAETAERLVRAREAAPFQDLSDLARRAGLSRHEMDALASADALRPLAGHRRQALWGAATSLPEPGLLADAAIREQASPSFAAATPAQDTLADYRYLGLTLGAHPLQLLRAQLAAQRYASAAALREAPDRRLVRACGLVTARQRPGTAKGTVFVSLEDETGTVNVIVHAALAERQRRELRGARLLGVLGRWQAREGVHNLIAGRLVDLTALLGALPTRSRDFH